MPRSNQSIMTSKPIATFCLPASGTLWEALQVIDKAAEGICLMVDENQRLLGTVTEASPYPGAKSQLQITEQLEDQQLIVELMRATAAELPAPKLKAAKKAR